MRIAAQIEIEGRNACRNTLSRSESVIANGDNVVRSTVFRNPDWSLSVAVLVYSFRMAGGGAECVRHAERFQLTVVAATTTGASSRCLVVHLDEC
jgi:hypothetical protein